MGPLTDLYEHSSVIPIVFCYPICPNRVTRHLQMFFLQNKDIILIVYYNAFLSSEIEYSPLDCGGI
jgi:hypothetical protein